MATASSNMHLLAKQETKGTDALQNHLMPSHSHIDTKSAV